MAKTKSQYQSEYRAAYERGDSAGMAAAMSGIKSGGSSPSAGGDTPRGGGIGQHGREDSIAITNQSPGWEGQLFDGTSLTGGSDPYNKPFQDGSAHNAYLNSVAPAPIDPYAALLEAQRQSRIARLDSAKTRALSALDSSYGNRKTALETAKGGYLTNLDTALQSSIENIGNEEAKIDPYYYDKRNQVQAQSDVGAMNFAQYMAGRGIKGAAGGMPEIYRNAATQGEIGRLNRQQAANQAEIDRMRTTTQNQYDSNRSNVLNSYEADLLGLTNEYNTSRQGMADAYEQDRMAALADIDSQGLQAYIDQANADRLFSLNEAQITGTYGGEPTLAGQSWQQTLEDKGKQSYLDTIGRFGDNYQQEINNVMNDNDTTNDWQIAYLQAARQEKIQGQAEAKAAAAAAAGEEAQLQFQNALDLWKVSKVATPEIAQILGVPENAYTGDYNIDLIDAQIKQQNADTGRINANKPSGSGGSGGSGGGGTSDKSALTNTQYLSAAKAEIQRLTSSGAPYHNKYSFGNWLDQLLPQTEEGQRLYDEIWTSLNVDLLPESEEAARRKQYGQS